MCTEVRRYGKRAPHDRYGQAARVVTTSCPTNVRINRWERAGCRRDMKVSRRTWADQVDSTLEPSFGNAIFLLFVRRVSKKCGTSTDCLYLNTRRQIDFYNDREGFGWV